MYCARKYLMKSNINEDTVVLSKTRELCQAILDQPHVKSIRQRIDTFMADSATQSQYSELVSQGQALQEKQQNAVALSNDEIEQFEKSREALLNNPVARNFLDAQEELHTVKQSIHQYLNKTLELGRLPTDEDLKSGSCGHGCGCSH